jgi:WD40 repeat protein
LSTTIAALISGHAGHFLPRQPDAARRWIEPHSGAERRARPVATLDEKGVLVHGVSTHSTTTFVGHPFNASGTAIARADFTDAFGLWDWPSGEWHVFLGHSVFVNSVRFLADGRTLVSCGADRVLKFWDIATGQERFNLQSATSIYSCMGILPCETVIAAGSRDGTIRLFRRATVEEVKAAGW